MNRNSRGMTVIEMMLATALAALALFALVNFFAPTSVFFNQSSRRAQVDSHARMLMDTIVRVLRNGKAGTVVISTPPMPGPVVLAPPNSQIDFDTVDNRHYRLAWSSSSPGTVTQLITAIGGPVIPATQPTAIAKNVTGIMFALDARDPAIVIVSMRMDVPIDDSGRADHVYSVILPNQEVHLVGTSNR